MARHAVRAILRVAYGRALICDRLCRPMYSVDAQPFECKTHKRQINPYQRTASNVSDGDGKLWRLATAGGDKKVRVSRALLETAKKRVD